MILSSQSIKLNNIIEPFFERTTNIDGLTYGVGPASYDVRIDQTIILGAGECSLASTVEKFNMPAGICGMVADKSTWARRFICVQNTFIDPGWRGYLTLEITNHSFSTVVIRKNTPIAQIVFMWLDAATENPYEGKYQDQRKGAVEAIYETQK